VSESLFLSCALNLFSLITLQVPVSSAGRVL
jgi:hypothetical protein